jgi:hypothetical protein
LKHGAQAAMVAVAVVVWEGSQEEQDHTVEKLLK